MWPQVEARLREWQPDAIVVGVPFHPDGASHENTARARKFARQLRGRFRLAVFEVDERYSTTEALASGLGVVTYRHAAGNILIRAGENGVAVAPGDARSFVTAAVLLAGDAGARERLGRQACESMQAHGWEAIVARFETVLREVAGRS